MGGYGSGRWHWHTKKTAVENCWVLNISRLYRQGFINGRGKLDGSLWWTYKDTGKKTASLGFQFRSDGPFSSSPPVFRLIYTVTKSSGEKHDVDLPIKIQFTRPYRNEWGEYGWGFRWWFTCPLVKGGVACERRVGKLYLPPNALYFGCRHCYDLTYISCQTSDKRVSALSQIPPDVLTRAVESGSISPWLAIKALEKKKNSLAKQ